MNLVNSVSRTWIAAWCRDLTAVWDPPTPLTMSGRLRAPPEGDTHGSPFG
jgi:hypothetical protein